jgi:hypothetical protein
VLLVDGKAAELSYDRLTGSLTAAATLPAGIRIDVTVVDGAGNTSRFAGVIGGGSVETGRPGIAQAPEAGGLTRL